MQGPLPRSGAGAGAGRAAMGRAGLPPGCRPGGASWAWLAVAPFRPGKWRRWRPVRGHVEEQPGSDGAAGPGPAADRGSLERREGAGLVAVRRTARRPAAGVELETLGGLERGHVGCRVSPASAFMICVI